VWNQRWKPADIEVTVGGALLFSGPVHVAGMNPAIVVFEQVFLKRGTYRVVARDRILGLANTFVLHLGEVANINVFLNHMPPPPSSRSSV
jgi:hypothetical protein